MSQATISPPAHTSKRFGVPSHDARGLVAIPPTTSPRTPPPPIRGKKRFACRVSEVIPAIPQTAIPSTK